MDWWNVGRMEDVTGSDSLGFRQDLGSGLGMVSCQLKVPSASEEGFIIYNSLTTGRSYLVFASPSSYGNRYARRRYF